MAALVPVLSDSADKTPVSKTASRFREIIMNFKNHIYDSLETDGKGNQNIEHLNDATNRVIHLGNVLKLLLKGNYDPVEYDKETNSSIQSVKRLFEEGGIDFQSIDDSTRQECTQIIEYDIYWFPYSLSKGHTKSLVKSRI